MRLNGFPVSIPRYYVKKGFVSEEDLQSLKEVNIKKRYDEMKSLGYDASLYNQLEKSRAEQCEKNYQAKISQRRGTL